MIRRIHLFASLALLVWVGMYFVTGYVLIHENLFPRGESEKNTRKVELAAPLGEDAPLQLQRRFGIHGKRGQIARQKNGTWSTSYSRPGFKADVVIAADGKSATITEVALPRAALLIGLHRQHGYGGGTAYDIWAICYDLASFAMIVFSVTGVILWHKTAKQKAPGWICLFLSCSFTLATILSFLLHR